MSHDAGSLRWTGTVPAPLAGERLDQVLAALVPGISRAQAKRLVDEGLCLVDGKQARPSARPLQGAELTVTLAEPRSEITPEALPLSIIYEDPVLIAVNKPAGMSVHPARGTPGGTLINALAHHLGGEVRPTLVHRLDRDTSGVILAAKSTAAHADLRRQMEAGELKRVYWALVWGALAPAGTIDAPIAQARGDKTRMCIAPDGKPAITHYQTLRVNARSGEEMALVEVRLETGRTHQIRVHFEHLGHPLLGERVYRGGRPLADFEAALAGQALHSRELTLRHPVSGARLTLEADLPEAVAALCGGSGL